jgi:hypothetical protein
MSISFRCPFCGHKLRAEEQAAGRRGTCKCQRVVVVPRAATMKAQGRPDSRTKPKILPSAPAAAGVVLLPLAPDHPDRHAIHSEPVNGGAGNALPFVQTRPRPKTPPSPVGIAHALAIAGVVAAILGLAWIGCMLFDGRPSRDAAHPDSPTPVAEVKPPPTTENPPLGRTPTTPVAAPAKDGKPPNAPLPGVAQKPFANANQAAKEPPRAVKKADQIEILEWYTADWVSNSNAFASSISLRTEAQAQGLTLVAVKARFPASIGGFVGMLPSTDLKLVTPDGTPYFVEGLGWESFSAPSSGGLVLLGRRELTPEEQARGFVDRGSLFAAPLKQLEAGRMRFQYLDYPAVPLELKCRRKQTR